jgi:hypothetical protein
MRHRRRDFRDVSEREGEGCLGFAPVGMADGNGVGPGRLGGELFEMRFGHLLPRRNRREWPARGLTSLQRAYATHAYKTTLSKSRRPQARSLDAAFILFG